MVNPRTFAHFGRRLPNCTLAYTQRPIRQRQTHPPIALPMRLTQADGNLQCPRAQIPLGKSALPPPQ